MPLIQLVWTLYSFFAMTSHLGLDVMLPPCEELAVHEAARQGYESLLQGPLARLGDDLVTLKGDKSEAHGD